MLRRLEVSSQLDDNESSLCRQKSTNNRGRGMIRYVCTRELGGEEGKKVCFMITCIVFTIPNVLLLIANENKPYFGGKTEDH